MEIWAEIAKNAMVLANLVFVTDIIYQIKASVYTILY